MSTDGFSFKLGRMRMNVERKRISVAKQQQELEQMEVEFQMMCPHAEVDRKEVMIQGNDFYYRNEPHIITTCKVCGYETRRKL